MKAPEIRKFYDDVARLIASARNSQVPSLTQQELAGRTNSVTRSAIANIESLRQRVALHQLLEIADALSSHPLELIPKAEARLGASEPVPGRDNAAAAFLSALRDANTAGPSQEES